MTEIATENGLVWTEGSGWRLQRLAPDEDASILFFAVSDAAAGDLDPFRNVYDDELGKYERDLKKAVEATLEERRQTCAVVWARGEVTVAGGWPEEWTIVENIVSFVADQPTLMLPETAGDQFGERIPVVGTLALRVESPLGNCDPGVALDFNLILTGEVEPGSGGSGPVAAGADVQLPASYLGDLVAGLTSAFFGGAPDLEIEDCTLVSNLLPEGRWTIFTLDLASGRGEISIADEEFELGLNFDIEVVLTPEALAPPA